MLAKGPDSKVSRLTHSRTQIKCGNILRLRTNQATQRHQAGLIVGRVLMDNGRIAAAAAVSLTPSGYRRLVQQTGSKRRTSAARRPLISMAQCH
jgi:hypothetical protein